MFFVFVIYGWGEVVGFCKRGFPYFLYIALVNVVIPLFFS